MGRSTFTLPGHVGGCGPESRSQRTESRKKTLFFHGFLLKSKKDGIIISIYIYICKLIFWNGDISYSFFFKYTQHVKCWEFGMNLTTRKVFRNPRNGMPPDQKKKAYRCDVTYVTNSHWVSTDFVGTHGREVLIEYHWG